MANEEKQQKPKRRREAYKRNKIIKDSTQLQNKYKHVRNKYADLKLEQKTKISAGKAEVCKYADRTKQSWNRANYG